MTGVIMNLPVNVVHDMKHDGREFSIYIRLGETEHTFNLTVKYELGGHNWWTYKTDPRGIFMGCTPMKIGLAPTSDAVVVRSFTAFSGIKILLKELNRYTEKQLLEQATLMFGDGQVENWDPKVFELIKEVCIKNKVSYELEHALFGEN
ncbi:MAG TPA: hypothetical protein VMW53_01635 [archaeon]|nr:hypothetical protein [archaeon]